MNYIKKLEQNNKHLTQNIERTNTIIDSLRAFLLTEKFHVDTTIQVADVDRYLLAIRSKLNI